MIITFITIVSTVSTSTFLVIIIIGSDSGNHSGGGRSSIFPSLMSYMRIKWPISAK